VESRSHLSVNEALADVQWSRIYRNPEPEHDVLVDDTYRFKYVGLPSITEAWDYANSIYDSDPDGRLTLHHYVQWLAGKQQQMQQRYPKNAAPYEPDCRISPEEVIRLWLLDETGALFRDLAPDATLTTSSSYVKNVLPRFARKPVGLDEIAAARIAYHSDFDWDNTLMSEFIFALRRDQSLWGHYTVSSFRNVLMPGFERRERINRWRGVAEPETALAWESLGLDQMDYFDRDDDAIEAFIRTYRFTDAEPYFDAEIPLDKIVTCLDNDIEYRLFDAARTGTEA
jgi:hypothetical protein